MENLQDEEWIYFYHANPQPKHIAAISNRGRYVRYNGSIGILRIRKQFNLPGVRKLASHIIAEKFLITVKRPDQVLIDHITHHPDEMYVNDVRNLRWCNRKENANFEEAKINFARFHKDEHFRKKMSAAKVGKCMGPDHPNWNPVRNEKLDRRLGYIRERRAKKRAAKLNAQQP